MQEISAQLKKVIQDLYGLDFDPELSPSPANINADYSTNAPLKLAKVLHKSPMEIGEKLDCRKWWKMRWFSFPKMQLFLYKSLFINFTG